MTDNGSEPTPAKDVIEVHPPSSDAHVEAVADPNVALEAANKTLASRPRRSLRSAGRAAEEKTVTNTVKKTVKIIARRAQGKWDAERLLTDPKSPLAKANLRTILANPMAWNCLDAADHAEILALFPDQRHITVAEDGAQRPNMESLMNDDSFRYDCAAYTESLAQGRHDPDWLAQAWAAHERRKAGDFDDFLRAKFEKEWEVKLPEEAPGADDEKGGEEGGGDGVANGAVTG
ncbi:hypothetical protein CRV24_003912 [Beauveria bassiana]|uniref:Proline-rich early nodulin n=1 Tax=Beauveria bassiana (strain ARSEF 2860) TaxID=655819 RepID=J4W209_BEAB2|nr:proline-rich early nodulin [Beauveria bassiana ARSEF 2860]EJP64510.1 proline-rich early nodulin [Beauveria bassiana ARSEF 2860]KAF1734994.1 hypothetical protein CRV24_003912 [Beauveria bassiana]KAH8710511.1 hypothetical protein HC256_007349 [Beauveria bassiana]